MAAVSRIFVEKKQGYDVEAKGLYRDLSENLHIDTLTSVRVINRYDVAGLNEEEFSRTIPTVFSEPQVDDFYLEEMPQTKGAVFAYEYLTGQYDQRADSAAPVHPNFDSEGKAACKNCKNNCVGRRHLSRTVAKSEEILHKPCRMSGGFFQKAGYTGNGHPAARDGGTSCGFYREDERGAYGFS